VHFAGEKCFVEYAGLTMPVHDAATHTVREAQIFVAAPGTSQLLDAGPTWTQTMPLWIGAHVRLVDDVGGVPALTVPDNLKAAVTQPCDYELTVRARYQDFSTHYGTAKLAARARNPRDKAKVETAVQIVEREIGSRCGGRCFTPSPSRKVPATGIAEPFESHQTVSTARASTVSASIRSKLAA
jgi:transposase